MVDAPLGEVVQCTWQLECSRSCCFSGNR